MKDLLAWSSYQQREMEISGRYGLAWAFVHFAINREPQRFASLRAELVDGRDDAFQRAFGEPNEALDQAIYGYLKQGHSAQLRLEVPLSVPTLVKFEPTEQPEERLHALEQAMKPR